ncbi:hypothetical protein K491DRAFT_658648 [Lophiostoma macrostomum CBS 122681]|uniref:Heterokaryon incompatibility domain-containing protein n=1 Tax=Lophiostoma macrostomum CBS 122681 TaxID=1314788 RepID=A0A6A6T5K2_9PLEO|nr:hypothetical protein K491DRAFT_658648 [Lophiostoma macrostomum CBS 122681]
MTRGRSDERNDSVYPVLEHSDSIRLLRFSRRHGGAFHGELKAFRLNRTPPFYTASYVWGPPTTPEFMTFNSGSLPVLSSLAPFLRMIKLHDNFSDGQWWWFDSICINLEDSSERSAQVQMMGDIYRTAQRTCIWLGEEREEGKRGRDCLGAIQFLVQLANLRDALNTSAQLRKELRDEKFAGQWQAVGSLLGRPWWTRVWTLQEYILPREAKFYCGSSGISRSALKSAIYSIYLVTNGHDDDLFPRANFDAAWNRRRIRQWYTENGEMGVVAMIAYLGNHSATDTRDRVYSSLGLIGKRNRRLIGKPDYESSVEQVYAGLVERFWREYGCLDIICFTHLFNRDAKNIGCEERQGILPSWAPDWRAFVQSSPVPLMASQSSTQEMIGNCRPLATKKWTATYRATGKDLRNKAKVRFAKNLKEMWCDGVILDVVDGLGGLDGCDTRCTSSACNDGHPLVQSAQGKRLKALPEEILESLTCSLVLDRSDKYLGHAAPNHYMSDFLSLYRRAMGGEQVDLLFRVWYEQNKDLDIGGQTLSDIIMAVDTESKSPTRQKISSTGRPRIDSANTYVKAEDTFMERLHDVICKKSRRLMVTEQSYMGVAPCRAQQGDVVAILFGCSIPLVLRRVGSREAWEVVGEAYVHGYMNGQVEGSVRDGRREVRTFRLV